MAEEQNKRVAGATLLFCYATCLPANPIGYRSL